MTLVPRTQCKLFQLQGDTPWAELTRSLPHFLMLLQADKQVSPTQVNWLHLCDQQRDLVCLSVCAYAFPCTLLFSHPETWKQHSGIASFWLCFCAISIDSSFFVQGFFLWLNMSDRRFPQCFAVNRISRVRKYDIGNILNGRLEKELRMKQTAQTKLCWKFKNLGLFDQFKTQSRSVWANILTGRVIMGCKMLQRCQKCCFNVNCKWTKAKL